MPIKSGAPDVIDILLSFANVAPKRDNKQIVAIMF